MVDPISAGVAAAASAVGAGAGSLPAWLPWAGAAAAGGAGLAAGSMLSGKGAAPAPQVNIPAPPGLNPATLPNQKPARKSQQQSFLSGAAMAQQSGAGGTSQGKSLLGA